jgi:hypothetical protein
MNDITARALANPSEDVIRRNPHVFKVNGSPSPEKPVLPQPEAMMSQPAESHDVAKLNKIERAFWDHLNAGNKLGLYWYVGAQNITLKLADDCRYTPDFVTVSAHGGRLIAYEVKGFWRDDAKVKIKVAARLFPWIQFIVVTRKKGNWSQEAVRP